MRTRRQARSADPSFASERFELAICAACGTAATLGPPPLIETAHETVYYAPAFGARDRLIEPLRRLAERDRIRDLRGLPSGSRVLEVGSGDGRFLARLRDRGFDPVGIEPSARAASPAGGTDGMDGIAVINTPLESAELEPTAFDAVVLWHSLEHFEDPLDALQRVRAWLKPHGEVVIGVPNRRSLQAWIGGDRWFHQDVPRHRTHFTPAGLRALLARAGFDVIAERHLVVDQNPLGMLQTLLNRLTGERDVFFRIHKRDSVLQVARRDRIITALALVPLIPFAILAELAAGAARRGGSIAVIARRLEG